jgi:signal transduction histidine kinase
MMQRLRRNLSVSILLAVSLTLSVLFTYNTWALSATFEQEQLRHRQEHKAALDRALREADPGTDVIAIGERLAASDPSLRYVITDDRGAILFDSDRNDRKVGQDVSRLIEDEKLGFSSAPWQHPYRQLRWRFFVFWDRDKLTGLWIRRAYANLGVSLLACGFVLLAVIHRITGHASAKYEQLIREVEALEEARLKAQKHEALSKMAAGVAHEIRNPLNSIGIGIQRLQLEFGEREPELVEITKLLVEEVGRVNRIIEEFLRFARPPRLTLATFDLRELVNEMIAVYREDAAQHGVHLTASGPEGEFPIEADRDQLKQALLNVMLNGVQSGGTSVQVEVAGARGGPYRLRVIDDGPGIHPETKAQIFDLYFTTKEQGSGLGLSIVQRIIEEGHGGRIHVDSAPGRTCFEMELPGRAT